MITIGTLQQYNIDLTKIYNWLPWGGLIYPQVIRNKDNSLMGFIRYTNTVDSDGLLQKKTEQIKEFIRGWAIWVDLQHFEGEDSKTLTLLWNPAKNQKTGMIFNSLDGKEYSREQAEKYFITVLHKLHQDLSTVVDTEILEYGDILSYLASTLTNTRKTVEMYSPALYYDAVLSRNVDFEIFGAKTEKRNDLRINGRDISIVTPMGYPSMPIMNNLFHAFRDFDYRFVKRFEFWDQEGAEKELKGYVKDWCRGRSSIKEYMTKDLLKKFNGVYTNTFVFQFSDEKRIENEAYIKKVLETIELPHTFEAFNRKHCWWGSIPGLFRANIVGPIKGIERLGDLLILTEDAYV